MSELFHNSPITSLISNELVALSESAQIGEALQALATNHISSAPVLHKDNIHCLGSVDTLDLLMFVMNAPTSLDWYEDIRDRFFQPVHDSIDFSYLDPFVPVRNTISVGKVVDLFAKGVHRVPVFNQDNKLCGNLSQSDIISFLVHHLERSKDPDLKELSRMTVNQFDWTKDVYAIHDNATLFDAFKSLGANNVRGLAVINFDGQLVGNISATDFVGITSENLYATSLQKVKEFVENQPLLYVHRDTTFMEVIKHFHKTMKHRIYVVSNDGYQPIGVITLTDVMQALIKYLNL